MLENDLQEFSFQKVWILRFHKNSDDLERNSHKIDIKEKFFLKKLFCLFPFYAWSKFWMRSLRLDSNKFQFHTFFLLCLTQNWKLCIYWKNSTAKFFKIIGKKYVVFEEKKMCFIHSICNSKFFSPWVLSQHSFWNWCWCLVLFCNGIFFRETFFDLFQYLSQTKKSKNKLLCPNEREFLGKNPIKYLIFLNWLRFFSGDRFLVGMKKWKCPKNVNFQRRKYPFQVREFWVDWKTIAFLSFFKKSWRDSASKFCFLSIFIHVSLLRVFHSSKFFKFFQFFFVKRNWRFYWEVFPLSPIQKWTDFEGVQNLFRQFDLNLCSQNTNSRFCFWRIDEGKLLRKYFDFERAKNGRSQKKESQKQ